MLSCKEATRLVSENLDRTLPFWMRVGLRFHVAMCRGCSTYKRQAEALNHLISRRYRDDAPSAGDDTLPAERVAGIKASLRSEDR